MPHDAKGLALTKGDRVHVIPEQMSAEVISVFGCEALVRLKNGDLAVHPGYELQRQRAA